MLLIVQWALPSIILTTKCRFVLFPGGKCTKIILNEVIFLCFCPSFWNSLIQFTIQFTNTENYFSNVSFHVSCVWICNRGESEMKWQHKSCIVPPQFYIWLSAGIYVCSQCANPLFSSRSKYAHSSPWPAFTETIHKDSVTKVMETLTAYKVHKLWISRLHEL